MPSAGEVSYGWEAVTIDHGDHAHVIPVFDSISHDVDPDGDCICGTRIEPNVWDDGTINWMITHFALDGRE